jgi:hypothetical protein
MTYARKAPEQSPFVCILVTTDGSRRFRTAVMADDEDEVREKAGRIAGDMIGRIEVETVYSIAGPVGSEVVRERDNAPSAAVA